MGIKAIGIAVGIPGIYMLYLAAEVVVGVIGNDVGPAGLLMAVFFVLHGLIPLLIAYMLIVKFSAKSVRLLCALTAFVCWLLMDSEMNAMFDAGTFKTEYSTVQTRAFAALASLIAALLMIWVYRISARLLIKWAAIDENAEKEAARDRSGDHA
jgi:hypothetical protein